MSQKPTFRSRKIDKHRQMCVLLEEDVDTEGTIRDTQNIDYGVDKEEADEEHLLTSLKTQFHNSKTYVPLPDVQLVQRDKRLFERPDDWIRNPTIEMVSFCASTVDLEFLIQHPDINIDDFEFIMNTCDEMMLDRLPQASLFDIGDLVHKIVTAKEKPQLEEIIPVIYSHYTALFEDKNDIIMPILLPAEKYEQEGHPYKCFRAREVATFRKTRQSQSSTSRLKQWNSELNAAHHILQLVSRREKTQKELMLLDQVIFEKKLRLKLKRKQLGLPDEEHKPITRQKVIQIGDGIKKRIAMDKGYVDTSLNMFTNENWSYRLRQHLNTMIIDKNKSYDPHDVFSDEDIEEIDIYKDDYKQARMNQLTRVDYALMDKK